MKPISQRGKSDMKRLNILSKNTASAAVYKRKFSSFVFKLFRTLFIIGLCYLFLFPIFYMFSVAFQDPSAVNDPTVLWIPKTISLKSIKAVSKFINYKDSLILTLTISVLSTLGTLISCSMVGYSIARFKYFENKILYFIVLITIVVPPPALLSASYINYSYFDFGGILSLFGKTINLINTPWTFILPAFFASGLRSGLFIFIFIQAFKGMPKDLEEAAAIDGCGPFGTYVKIIIPLAVPTIITVMLFSFIWHWNDYYNSTMYFNSNLKPLTVELSALKTLLENSKIVASGLDTYGMRTYLQAGACLVVFPPLFIYVFTQRYFTESIERTGIVG